MNDLFINLWNIAETMIKQMGIVWEWLNTPLTITISWFKIPLILPNGVHIATGIVPIALLGVGILALLAFWLVKALVPML